MHNSAQKTPARFRPSSSPLAPAALAVTGFGAMPLIASSNTVLQTILEEDKRGWVMSFFTMAFIGVAPLASLGAESMTEIIGPRNTLLLGSIGCLIGAAIFARHLPQIREKIRPIYLRMGIIQEVATGLATATEQAPLLKKMKAALGKGRTYAEKH